MNASAESASISERRLTPRGPLVSAIGFGAEALGRTGRTLEAARSTLHAVIDAGVTLIDTASCYGESERFVGDALGDHRARVTVITKCGWANGFLPRWRPDEIALTIEESLRSLRVDALDVLLLHGCPLELLEGGEQIAAIERARDAGNARLIGYSGDGVAAQYAIATGRFDVLETTINLLDQANAPLIAQATSQGMAVLAKRSIANAVPGRDEAPRSPYAAQYWPRWQSFREAIQHDHPGWAPDHGWLDAALRWSAFDAGVTAVLIGSSHASHIHEQIERLHRGPLDRSVAELLRVAYERVSNGWPALG